MTTRSEDEVADEHNEKEKERSIDEDALAALVRPSLPPVERDEEEEQGPEEDSVLDLRALAASAPPPPMEEPAAQARGGQASAADTESAAKAAGPADEPAVAARPAAAERRGSGGLITGLLIGAAAVVGVVWYMGRGPGGDEPPAIASTAPANVEAAEPLGADEGQRSIEAFPSREGEPAAQQGSDTLPSEAEAAEVSAGAEPVHVANPRLPRTHPGSASASPPSGEGNATAMAGGESSAATTMAQASATTMSSSATEGGLDSMLDRALGGRPTEGGTRTEMVEPAPAAAQQPTSQDLPASPSRADVSRALGRLLPGIRQCAGDQVGMANATIIVRNDGTVASVSIGGSPFGGTPQGACMEGVIRRATFSRFSQSTFRISYPFAIRPAP